MRTILKVLILSIIIEQCFTCDDNNGVTASNITMLSRPKRYLDFLKATRTFFRANIKETVFTWGAIWAHASGFKANFNMLNSNKALRPYRRDTYETLQNLMDLHGFDGKACVLKAYCTVTRDVDGGTANGMLFKLLRHVFTGIILGDKLDGNLISKITFLMRESSIS